MSTDDTAVAEDLAPLPDLPGPAHPELGPSAGAAPGARPGSQPDDQAGEHAHELSPPPAAGPGIAPWDDLYERSDADADAARAAADKALARVARDHQAALDHAAERPELPQDRPAGDDGQPFDVAPGSYLAAAACPPCGYGLGGRTAVLVLAGRGAQRTAVAVHEGCAGEAL